MEAFGYLGVKKIESRQHGSATQTPMIGPPIEVIVTMETHEAAHGVSAELYADGTPEALSGVRQMPQPAGSGAESQVSLFIPTTDSTPGPKVIEIRVDGWFAAAQGLYLQGSRGTG